MLIDLELWFFEQFSENIAFWSVQIAFLIPMLEALLQSFQKQSPSVSAPNYSYGSGMGVLEPILPKLVSGDHCDQFLQCTGSTTKKKSCIKLLGIWEELQQIRKKKCIKDGIQYLRDASVCPVARGICLWSQRCRSPSEESLDGLFSNLPQKPQAWMRYS